MNKLLVKDWNRVFVGIFFLWSIFKIVNVVK